MIANEFRDFSSNEWTQLRRYCEGLLQEAQLRFLPKETLVRYLEKVAQEEEAKDGAEGRKALSRDFDKLKALVADIKGHTETKL